MSRGMGAKPSWALSGLALDSSSGAPGPLKVQLQGEGGHKTCLPTLLQPCSRGPGPRNQGLEKPVEKWSLYDNIQYVCNKGEMEKMLI